MKTHTKNSKSWKKVVAGLLAVSMCGVLVPVPTAFAASESGTDNTGISTIDSDINTFAQAEIESKNEVIYAMLDYSGGVQEAYAVNSFKVNSEGSFTDYGTYSTVGNLTNTKAIEQSDDEFTLAATEGEFYYQGAMTTPVLPWQISINYTLDGVKIAAKDIALLGGESGRLGITIASAKTPDVTDESFYEHYALQISLTLPTGSISNLSAVGATITAAGSDTQISYVVLPGSDASYDFAVDFENITMPGISVAAVPYGSSFDIPDTSGISDELSTLVNSITTIYSSTSQLSSGLNSASLGLASLASGSSLYNSGILQLSTGSAELREGSANFNSSLSSTASGFSSFIDNLVQSGALMNLTSDQLTQLYTYITTMQYLANGYTSIDSGLQEYTSGVDALAAQYSEINTGINQATSGIDQLNSGMSQLNSGMGELTTGIADMPEEMQARIDEFAASYDFSGFESHSYLSPKNSKVVLVQFVLTTPAIELPAEPEEEEEVTADSSFWDKLLDLFTNE